MSYIKKFIIICTLFCLINTSYIFAVDQENLEIVEQCKRQSYPEGSFLLRDLQCKTTCDKINPSIKDKCLAECRKEFNKEYFKCLQSFIKKVAWTSCAASRSF